MTRPRQFGKFELLRRIGAGGAGEIYEASLRGSAGFSKRVALKLLLPDLRKEPEIVSMFIDEARITSSMNHPNIVNVYEFGEIDKTYFMAMEYVDGRDLRDLINDCRRTGRPFPLDAAAYVVRELSRGLHYIHGAEQEVVHRDVTPKNIFVTPQGQVKLGDFGIALAQARLTRTKHGQVKGTLPYLAPEQTTGEPVTARTDVYAAGLVLFELLAGRRLIQGRNEAEVLSAAMNPPDVAPSSIRAEAAPLDGIVRRALERQPTLRYRSAAQLADALERFLTPGSAAPASLVKLATENWRRPTLPAAEQAHGPTEAAAPAVEIETRPLQHRPGERTARTRRLPPAPASRRRNRQRAFVGAIALVGLVGLAGSLLWSAWFSQRTAVRSTVPDAAGPAPLSLADGGARPLRSVSTITASNADAHVQQPEMDGASLTGRAPASPGIAPVGKRKRRFRRPQRPRTPVRSISTSAADASPRVAAVARSPLVRKRLQQQLRTSLQTASSRGLWAGDDSAFDQDVALARRLLRAKDFRTASEVLERVQNKASSFAIDRPFVQNKMKRLDRVIRKAQLTPQRREELAGETQTIVRLIMENHLVKASARMSRMSKLLTTSK